MIANNVCVYDFEASLRPDFPRAGMDAKTVITILIDQNISDPSEKISLDFYQ